MKRNIINAGLAVMALAMSFGLSGCGRSKQNAALALDEARLNIAAARNSGAQKYAPETLKEAEDALRMSDKAYNSLHFDMAKTEAEKAVQLAVTAQVEAEKKAAEKKLKAAKNTASPVKRTTKQTKKK